ncbi:hypothetical protein TrLO_g12565 [Triparma laevis f. longispina]|uniref:F-box/LRR-repeat protein 15-like leucin rich repeat domain-containing protein n=1 Tax=Triparma laevis f. longispina TaxID=1714387 RepID=A0A9W7DXA8_9STRA|nr:hypothetical protein TrLO_g12565 [Triparma laevis f. longispina]
MSFVSQFFASSLANPAVEELRNKKGSHGDVVYHLPQDESEFCYYTQPLQFRLPVTDPPAPPVGSTSPRPATLNYWTVRTISARTGWKKDCATIGEMDTTSVIAFRDSDGNKGKTASSKESDNPTPPFPKGSASREYREGKFVEDNVLVPYDSPITIFTNYGVGGRFLGNELNNLTNNNSKVCWKTTSDDILEQRGKLTSWVIRRIRTQTVEAEEKEGEPRRKNDNFVRCGDVVYLESFTHPGFYVKPKNGINVVGFGREDAAIQVVAPSLRFAIKLGERTSMYRAAAVSARRAASSAAERRKNLLKVIKEAKERKQEECNINNILPVEVIRHILGFFQGFSNIYDEPKYRFLEPHKQQEVIDRLPISKRKENVKYLRKSREVCKLWDVVSTHFIKGLKAGDMLESGRGQKRYLLDRVLKFNNLVALNLRSMDSLIDSDIATLCPQMEELRVLNVGGCFKLTDTAVESMVMCEKLVHLNVATTQISDYALEIIASSLGFLVTVNLFGIKGITGDGVAYLAQKQKHLKSLNLRGSGNPLFTHVLGDRLKEMCVNKDCEVLTGKEKWESIY